MKPGLVLPVERPAAAGPGNGGGLTLVARPAGYRHRGIDISSKVVGLRELALEEGFRMNPADIGSLGLKDGDAVILTLGNGTPAVRGAIKADPECPAGAVYFTRPVVLGGLGHRRALAGLYHLADNPVPVGVSGAGTGHA